MGHKHTVLDLKGRKGARLVMLTAYDAPTARLGVAGGVDMLLVGDSLGMAVLGYDSTVPVTMADMLHHTKAARRGAPGAFIVADLPFLSYATVELALGNAASFMKDAGADSVKLEGGAEVAPIVQALVRAGIPVMGHLGLTPQTASALGGFKLQARDEDGGRRLLADTGALEQAGCWSVVLEMVPAPLAKLVTSRTAMPTIGIGAGPDCDGQVLVYNDLVGISAPDFRPKFLKRYAETGEAMRTAIEHYAAEVRGGRYPDEAHSFGMNADLLRRIESG
ncbi:MAG: 3-methyl-2-oxobutanoate hydroxymethyltransferase [Betaproteobacteria bacterium]|nr:3-methyl-2-oxobutanoate hydroxymethyltransferase [Betaproteobacteria bacterium]